MKRRLPLPVIAIVALAAAAGGFLLYRSLSGYAPMTPEPAADIALPRLDGSGEAHLSEYRGKLVLVNFWATWCAPCMKEIPLLVDAQARYQARGLQILGPAMDDPEAVKAELGHLGIRYPVFVGEQEIPAAMEGLGDTLGALPFSVLISADGYVVYRKHGEFSQEELSEVVEKHLPASAPAT